MKRALFLAGAVAALASCAIHKPKTSWEAQDPPSFTIADDGSSVTIGDEVFRAPEGVSFFGRGRTLHVVSLASGHTFDFAIQLKYGEAFKWPADCPLEPVDGTLVWRKPAASGSIAELVASSQLHQHDDHLHITHRYRNADWEALYDARSDQSPLPPIRRQVAAQILATMVDMKIPADNDQATTDALARAQSIMAKARRGLLSGLTMPQLDGVLQHNYEIVEDGRAIEVDGKQYRAGIGVMFSYCSEHFHVESTTSHWAQPVSFEESETPVAFQFPRSLFFEVDGDEVKERPATGLWKKLADTGQIRFTREHWHITEKYKNPKLANLIKAMDDPKRPADVRERARAGLFEILRLRLDMLGERELLDQLAAVDTVINRHWVELDKKPPKNAAKSSEN